MVMVIATILASVVAGILYRMGGAEGYNTKFRDFGVPTVGIALMLVLYPHYDWKTLLAYFLTFGLYFGSMTTYWKKKGTDAKWWNWLLTGLGYSVAWLPFAICSGNWLGFALRSIVVSVGTMLWSEKIGNAVVEEIGRGVITTVTLPLLLI
jgi:hypothetical protein